MRVLVPTLFLAACLIAGNLPVLGAPVKLQTFSLYGRSHVRLTEWARANGYEIQWLKKDQSLQLIKGGSKIVLGVDSRQAALNGVSVWLSHPVVLCEGVPCMSDLDLRTTLTPIILPPKNWSGAKVKTIVIDPGHGGKDPGNQAGANQEKKYALLLARELCNQLKEAGFDASLTRDNDTLLDLPLRPEIAKRRKADLFISLHWNSAGVGRNDVKGVETYCLTPAGASSTNAGGDLFGSGTKPGNRFDEKNLYLAYLIQKSLLAGVGAEDRGVRRARFAVLRTAEMPAVLIEGGFMSHPTEARRIFDPAYRKQMAKSIVNGITAYKKQVEPVPAKVK